MEDERNTYHTDVDFNKEDWQLFKNNKSETPQQLNGYDCGVFTIMYADFLTENLPLSFSQKDIALFRERICAALLRGNLDYPFEKMETEIENQNVSSYEAEYFDGNDGNYDVADTPSNTTDSSEKLKVMSMTSESEDQNVSNDVGNQISNSFISHKNCCVC